MLLNKQNYFSKEAESLYLGSTSFKHWCECEAREAARTKGEYAEEINDAFLLGSYVHAWNDNSVKELLSEHPEMFKKDGTLYAKYALGDAMINCLASDPYVQKMREGAEKERIFTGEIAGVKFKVMADIINLKNGYFADIKTTKDLSETYWEGKKVTFIDKYDYWTQIAIYAEIIRQNTGETAHLNPFIIAVDKKEVPDHEIIYMGTSWIPDKLFEVEIKLETIQEVRNGLREPVSCGRCDYCLSNKKIEKPISISEYRNKLGLE